MPEEYYIRFKDGTVVKLPYGFTWNTEKTLKVSHTIEELCDVFVMVLKDCEFPQLVGKMNYEYCKTQCKWESYYGAIWTDKGLIYVAKMNDKGELKLL